MGLVTAKEVAKAIKVDKYGFLGTFSGWLLMKVLKISTLNKLIKIQGESITPSHQ